MIEATEARKTAAKEAAERSRTAAESLIRRRKLHLAKMEPPTLSGKLKEYPSFREDLKVIVKKELKDTDQRYQIMWKVPERD